MKIVYVGDNRNRGNYGCRGTSTALSQLISRNHKIVGRVTGKYTHFDTGELYFVRGMSQKRYERRGRMNHWLEIKKVLYLFHRFLVKGHYYFSKYDFISTDLDQSIENLIACLPANPDLKELDLRQYDFDAMVINGEGSFIFSTPPWRESLVIAMEMHWAQKMGKPVFFLNGMLSDDPYSERNLQTIAAIKPVFEKCTSVCVRENISYTYAKNVLHLEDVKLYPDALFTWYDVVNDSLKIENGKYFLAHSAECDEGYYQFDFTESYICISASSSIRAATKNIDDAIDAYVTLTRSVREQFSMKVFLVMVCEGDDFLDQVGQITDTPVVPLETPLIAAAKILANARLYFSGRYHPSILASLGGTPCVFMSSNSHKTKSLQALLQYGEQKEYKVIPDEAECKKMIDLGKKYLSDESLRGVIQDRAHELSQMASKLSQEIHE